ncbi:TXD11 protein, partial [Atractosteus spatula]|nr:TXD11 protein [Atractosteus spatula]
MPRRVRDSLRQALTQMARRPAVLCGAVVLSCTLVLAIRLSCSRARAVVAPAPPPARFFSADAPVADLFLGQLAQAERLRAAAEVSLVCYYAPWCGRSVSARAELERVARRLAGQVQFVAVNCWWNQGRCRKQHNFYQYPVIHLYYQRFGPIEYRGPLTAAYLEQFTRRVMAPLEYLPSRDRLQDFFSYHEPGVVGYFEFNSSPQPPGYMVFLASALQALKRDFQAAVRFAVITNRQVAEAIPLQDFGAVYMRRHSNTSLIFPRHKLNFTSENVCQWVFEHREGLLQWLRPHGGKSRLLDAELRRGAALLVFLPFDPLAGAQPLVREVADVATRYHSCERSQQAERAEQTGFLNEQWPWSKRTPLFEHLCCNTVVLPQSHSISRTHNVCELCINQSAGVEPSEVQAPRCSFHEMEAAMDSFYLKERTFVHLVSRNTECSNIQSTYSPFSYYTACCKTLSESRADLDNLSEPPSFSSSSFTSSTQLQDEPRTLQNMFAHAESSSSAVNHHFLNGNITGLKCRTNKTLGFYMLDSHLHWKFAVRLGAPENGTTKVFTTIVNVLDEVHYVLDHSEFFKDALENFIRNYSVLYSPLKRYLVGDSVPRSSNSLINEVTTQSFYSQVMDPEKDVLLFYYTQWCGFCTVLNHVIIQLARFFQGNQKIAVCRINAAKNDLPWEYMVDRFPALLFFPRDRKHASVKFPDLPFTLPNLVRFVLRHSGRAPGPWRGCTGRRAGSCRTPCRNCRPWPAPPRASCRLPPSRRRLQTPSSPAPPDRRAAPRPRAEQALARSVSIRKVFDGPF